MALRWMSIDPGLKRTGWAVWQDERLLDWGLVTPRDLETTSFKLTAQLMADRVRAVMSKHRVAGVLCEMPEEHGSAKGRAALNSGSVRKLAFYVGLIGGMARGAMGANFDAVEPSRWKGTVPKEITQRRVLRSYPQVPDDLRSDVYDAIGLGRWRIRKTREVKNG